MHLGVDFGTTYTKIAFFDPQGDRLEQFVYPPPPGEKPYVPTAVAYSTYQGQSMISIGEAARHDGLNIPDTVFCENIKMLLPLKTPEEWQRHGWTTPRTPYEVTRDYFRHLLRESEGSFERRHGPITRMVVSVPELWQRQTNVGAETLRQILVDDLQLPVDHLQSEPVCAAAYYIWHTQPDLTQPLHLLVCDMGGGTFDMVLCRVQGSAGGYKIQVLDFDGLGQSGLGSAGVAFDQRVVTTAYQNLGHPPDPHDVDFIEVVRAFEEVKLQKHNEASRLFAQCRTSADHARDLADTELYQWKRKYKVTIEQVRECFAPIRAGITQVLDKLLARAQERQWTVERVALVGGFSQFPLVEQAILDHPGLQAGHGQRDSSLTLNSDERFYAVARGAALIAHEYIQIEEYYPHTLELLVHRTRPTYHQVALPIVEAGRMLAGRLDPYYAQQDGQKVVVTVLESAGACRRLPVQLRLMGKGEPLILETPETEFPPCGRYHVGVVIDRSNLGTLVFDPIEDGARRRYPLGNISPSLLIEEA